MLCFFPLVSRAEMSLSISANTNFYECIQMQFLHIVVETVLHSRQVESLDLRQWVRVVCYRAKKVIPTLHVTLVRLIELSLLKNRADIWFLISSDILVSMGANWKESGKGELTSGNTPIEVSFASKVPFLQYFQFTFKNQVCAPKTSSLVQDACTYQSGQRTNSSPKIKHLHFHQVYNHWKLGSDCFFFRLHRQL